KFWRAAESTIRRVEKFGDGVDTMLDNSGIEISTCAGKSFGLRNRIRQCDGGTFQFVAAICVRVRDRMQNSRKSRTSHCIFRREICASEKWAPVWSEKSCERPSTLSGNCAYSGLISRVHIG